MKQILTFLIVAAIATGCNTRTHHVADVTKADTIVLTKKPAQGLIHSLSVIGSGEIDGKGEIILILNGKPYKT